MDYKYTKLYDMKGRPIEPVPQIDFAILNTKNEKVKLKGLIDTGATYTTIPIKEIERLKPYLREDPEPKRVLDFEGKIHEKDAYWIRVLIAGNDFYIQVISSYGNISCIGRNVLNKCRLLLDGPKLSFKIW